MQIRNKISSRQHKILSLEKRINEIVDKIYKRFSESVGVENIHEYEKSHHELADERLRLHNQQSKIKYQYVYEFATCFKIKEIYSY